MEARRFAAALLAAVFVSLGAGYRTQNFVVEAPTKELAEEIGKAAERFRHDLAIQWTGEAMPNWTQPCPITVQVGDQSRGQAGPPASCSNGAKSLAGG